MSYQVDPKTLLFTDLTEEEAATLSEDVTALVLLGTGVADTEGFQAWYKVSGFAPEQTVLVMATAYPQRALLSLLRRRKD